MAASSRARAAGFFEHALRDVVYAARGLRRSTGVTLAVVLILALGVGANTTIFRFVSALLLQPPPVEAPERLLQVWNLNPGARSAMERAVPLSYPAYARYRDGAHSFSGMLAFDGDPATLSWMRGGRGEMVQAQFVSGNYFPVLGVRAIVGRAALPADDQTAGPPAVVVSHRFWREQLGGDSAVVGASITLNGVPCVVAGVAPPGFTGVLAALAPDVWVPLALNDAVRHERGRLASRSTFWLLAVGRLAPDATAAHAAAELRTLARQFAAEDRARPAAPGEPSGRSRGEYDAAVYPATLVPGPFRAYVGAFVGLLQAVVALLLLIAGANAANLFLAQALARRPEMATRSALGASRRRLVQLVLAQTVLLGALAGAAGLLVARQTAPALLRLIPPTLPVRLSLTTDWRVLVFAAAAALGAGLLFGLGPALRATRDVAGVLRLDAAGGRRGARLRDALVVTQVATSLVLLVSGALCAQSLRRAQGADPGFRAAHRVAAQLDLNTLGYTDSAGRVLQRRLLDRVAALPGVRRASTTQYLPLATTRMTLGVRVAGVTPPPGESAFQIQSFDVGPAFFATMGTPLLRGREFAPSDDERAPRVAVINEAMARRFWPDADAVGRTLTIDTGVPGGAGVATYEVVGVVATGKYRSLAEPPTPALFRAERQGYRARLTVVADVAGATPTAVLSGIRREVARLDPSLVLKTGTLEEHLGFALFPARAAGVALGAAGALGLVLALAGLAAVVAQSVAQRTREIGIRMALGAGRVDVLGHVVREGARLLATGVAIGLVLALGATRALSGLLYGIGASDPGTFAGAAAVLVATAVGACALAARRATRVDPITAIRAE